MSLLRRLQEPLAPVLIRVLGERRFRSLVVWVADRTKRRAVPRLLSQQGDVVSQFHVLSYHSGAEPHWRGVPISKSPLDLWVYQEIISELRPDLIIETGTYLGGSAWYFADLVHLLGRGRVVTVDVRDWSRVTHPRLTHVIGDSVAPTTLDRVRSLASGSTSVLVVLDSDHSAAHVARELRAYREFVTVGSYMVVEDTNLNGHPVLPEHGPGPYEAVQEFVAEDPDFVIDRSREKFLLSYFPSGYLQRVGVTSPPLAGGARVG